MSLTSDLASSRELFLNLTLRELRSKYKRSVLGWFWSMLNPLATMLIFSLVFRFFLKVTVLPGDPSGVDGYAFYLLCGLLPFNFLSGALTGGMSALTGNANLVKKVWFRRELLVAANTTSAAVSLLIELGVLAAVLLITGNMVLPWLLPTLVLIALQVCFVLGIALVAAVLNVYFRDLEHLVAILLQMLFYASPIIYPITLVSDAMRDDHELLLRIYEANPITKFVEAYRHLLYDFTFPTAGTMLYLVVASAVSLSFGLWVFGRFDGRLAEEL